MAEPLPTLKDVWGVVVFGHPNYPDGTRQMPVAVAEVDIGKEKATQICNDSNRDLIERGAGMGVEFVALPMNEVWGYESTLPPWNEYQNTLCDPDAPESP